ncbi:MAG: hypothetical protein H7Z15_19025 [Rhizobacter sp.]|nr:hypothetical protein [Rhizobacter sp.]
MKRLLTAALVLIACAGASAQPKAYDPMDDLVSTAKKEINAKGAIEQSKSRVDKDPRRQKVEKGFWQFFQGKRDARPGEFCTAVFWKADRMITVTGPGGAYRGAMLGFVAVEPGEGFPRPDDAKAIQKVQVTLKQGTDAPARVTAFNRTIGGMSDEIAFAVPTIDAALAGMEDKLAFTIDHEGKQIFSLAWHSGLAARDVMKKCLKGENVEGREVP